MGYAQISDFRITMFPVVLYPSHAVFVVTKSGAYRDCCCHCRYLPPVSQFVQYKMALRLLDKISMMNICYFLGGIIDGTGMEEG
jgi:hypothetical protein